MLSAITFLELYLFLLCKQVARKMREEDGFYYPHNLDFRGRAYPMHPHLSHLGSDLCRGVLEYAEGRPLGKSGLCWLKIHLANKYGGGVEKLSHEGKLAFVENQLLDIFDSAANPVDGNRWWTNAEDPFQCLAACMDLSDALKSPSPYCAVSHLPIHQVLFVLYVLGLAFHNIIIFLGFESETQSRIFVLINHLCG